MFYCAIRRNLVILLFAIVFLAYVVLDLWYSKWGGNSWESFPEGFNRAWLVGIFCFLFSLNLLLFTYAGDDGFKANLWREAKFLRYHLAHIASLAVCLSMVVVMVFQLLAMSDSSSTSDTHWAPAFSACISIFVLIIGLHGYYRKYAPVNDFKDFLDQLTEDIRTSPENEGILYVFPGVNLGHFRAMEEIFEGLKQAKSFPPHFPQALADETCNDKYAKHSHCWKSWREYESALSQKVNNCTDDCAFYVYGASYLPKFWDKYTAITHDVRRATLEPLYEKMDWDGGIEGLIERMDSAMASGEGIYTDDFAEDVVRKSPDFEEEQGELSDGVWASNYCMRGTDFLLREESTRVGQALAKKFQLKGLGQDDERGKCSFYELHPSIFPQPVIVVYPATVWLIHSFGMPFYYTRVEGGEIEEDFVGGSSKKAGFIAKKIIDPQLALEMRSNLDALEREVADGKVFKKIN